MSAKVKKDKHSKNTEMVAEDCSGLVAEEAMEDRSCIYIGTLFRLLLHHV